MVTRRRALLLAGVAAIVFAVVPAHAQSIQAIDQILAQIKSGTSPWGNALRNAALGTFAALAGVQFAWSMIRAAFNRHADMAEWMGELVNQAVFLGFFSFLLANAVTFGSAIIDSFRMAAGQAGGIGVTPAQVLAFGINIATQTAKGISALPYSAMPGAIICCAVVVVLYAIMAARLLTTTAKSIFWVQAGVFYFGFGGSTWTKEFAIGMVRHLFAIGAELFALQLLMSMCMSIMQSWVSGPTAAGGITFVDILVQLGCAVVVMVLVWEVPKEAQAAINGSAVSGPGLVGAAASLAASVAAAGAAMAGAGVMVAQAVKLAEVQTKAAEAGGGGGAGGEGAERSRVAHAAAVTGRALGNMVAAPAQDVGRRLSGQSMGHGSAPWRMAADMGNQARLLSGDAGRPAMGGATGAGASGAATANYQPWMSASGGYDALSPAHQASADRSYAEWQQTNPEAAARYGISDYVSYVQDKQAEREGRNT